MRVTIRHRQAGLGSFFVDCGLEFSEEEKAIIQHRGLGNHTIQIPSGIPRGSGINPDSWILRITIYPICFFFFLGLLFLLIGIVDRHALVWAFFLLTIAIGSYLFFWFSVKRRAAVGQDQIIPLQRLLTNPTLTVAATDINDARYKQDLIRTTLADMKQFLVGNAVLGNARLQEVETFEL